MSLLKMVRILVRITLLDEIVGFFYWGGVILGILLVFEHVQNVVALGLALVLLIVVSPLAYIKLSNIIRSVLCE